MERRSVKSANIASVGYDETSSTLEVEFQGGNVYQYFDVPSEVYQGLMSASSHGKYFHQNIKNSYKFQK